MHVSFVLQLFLAGTAIKTTDACQQNLYTCVIPSIITYVSAYIIYKLLPASKITDMLLGNTCFR